MGLNLSINISFTVNLSQLVHFVKDSLGYCYTSTFNVRLRHTILPGKMNLQSRYYLFLNLLAFHVDVLRSVIAVFTYSLL